MKTVAQGSAAWKMGLAGGNRTATIDGQQLALGGDIILSVDDISVMSEDSIEQIRNTLARGLGARAAHAPPRFTRIR